MERIISATDARIHFGKVMKQAKVGPVIVERAGKAEVVVISKKKYDQLVAEKQETDWREMLRRTHELVRKDLAGRELPDPAEMIREAREIRDEQLLNSLR